MGSDIKNVPLGGGRVRGGASGNRREGGRKKTKKSKLGKGSKGPQAAKKGRVKPELRGCSGRENPGGLHH